MSYYCSKCGKELVENNEKDFVCPNCESSINKTKDPIEEMPNLKADFELFRNQSKKDLSYVKEELKVLKEELSSGKKAYKTISLRKVHILSTAYLFAVISAISGFIIAILMSPFIMLIAAVLPPELRSTLNGSIIILLFIIVILYSIMGFIIGAIYAIMYNIVASITGGLKGDVDLDKREY
jgi:DNA-directed RNA polymerase subunit RPC12/RpoP